MAAKVTTAMVGEDMHVTVKGTTDRATVRKLAQEAAGTHFVGAAQEGAKVGTWLVIVSAKALAARKVVGKVPSAKALTPEAPKAANLDTLLASLDPAVAAAIRALVPATDAPKAPNTFVADVIKPRAEKRAACKCPTCRDYGIVRGAGERKGKPYTSPNGARGALAPMTCPACKGQHTEALTA